MIGRFVFGSGLIAGAAAAALATQAQPTPQPAPQPRPATISAAAAIMPNTQMLLDGWVRDNKMPGVVGAFGVGDFPTVFVQAGRIADEASAPAADPDSLWRVYSMTKPVTAFAAMLLIEDGKLRLDQPVSDILPRVQDHAGADQPRHQPGQPAGDKPITIRNLLTHHGGAWLHDHHQGAAAAAVRGARAGARRRQHRRSRPTFVTRGRVRCRSSRPASPRSR